MSKSFILLREIRRNKDMIINIGDNKVSLKQSASGFWYVNELSINSNSIMDAIALMDAAIYKTEDLLKKYNNQEEKHNLKKK